MPKRGLALLNLACLTLLAGCAGKGASFDDVGPALQASCAGCHDAAGFPELLRAVGALGDEHFTAAAFPDLMFPSGLVGKSTGDLVAAAAPTADATIPLGTADRKAWVLHELHELQDLLQEDVPPDFTDQQRFEAFALLGESGHYEGCEIGEKLDLGHEGHPEGMPPKWTRLLFELLARDDVQPLSPAGRQAIRDYVDDMLPGGLDACAPGEDSAS